MEVTVAGLGDQPGMRTGQTVEDRLADRRQGSVLADDLARFGQYYRAAAIDGAGCR